MPRKASNPENVHPTRKKASARQNAQSRIEEQRGTRGSIRTPTSHKEISQRRFPGETPLTGEDRPRRREGAKARGQSVSGVRTASGIGPTQNRQPTGKHRNPQTTGRPSARKGNSGSRIR
jgi:hypothetical protein